MHLKFAGNLYGLKSFHAVILMLLVSAPAFGYGIDGTKDSADFANQLGAYSGYANYQYEGGGDDPALDANHMAQNTGWSIEGHSSYDTMGGPRYTGTGASGIMNHTVASLSSSSNGPYKYLNNNALSIVAQDGYTYEFKAKWNDLTTYSTLVGQLWGISVLDDYQESNLRFLNGSWTGNVSQVKFGGAIYNLPGDMNEWHTYRVAVLGVDSAGDGLMHANLYQDSTLIGQASWATGSDPSAFIAWMGVAWGSDIGSVDVDLDYFRIGTGAWAPIPRSCSDSGVANDSDINKDCITNLLDFTLLAYDWMRCSDPAAAGCEKLPWIYEDFSAAAWNPDDLNTADMSMGTTNGWELTGIGGGSGEVYSASISPDFAAALTSDGGGSKITMTRDIENQAVGSVSFSYYNGISPDTTSGVELRASATKVMTLLCGDDPNDNAVITAIPYSGSAVVIVDAADGITAGDPAPAFGLDGIRDSADFENLEPSIRDGVSDYWNFSFEGGTPTAPLSARLSGWDSTTDYFSSYDLASDTNLYNSDGNTLSHTPATNWGYDSTGWYKPFNNQYYTPQGTTNAHGLWEDGINGEDGFTVEWRIAIGDHAGTDGLFMQFDVTDARDGWIRVNEQEVQFGVHGTVTAPTNTELMNTYRIVCFGVDPDGDPCAVMGSLYQNSDLLFDTVQIGTVGTVSTSSYLWAAVDFGTGWYYGSSETDYVRWDVMGAWAPAPQAANPADMIQVSFDFNTVDAEISNIDVRTDAENYNHAHANSVAFGTTAAYIDDVRFTVEGEAGGSNKWLLGRENGIAIDVAKTNCGDFGQAYHAGDIAPAGARDCYVNALDVNTLASEWLLTTDPVAPNTPASAALPDFQDVTSAVGLTGAMEGVTGVSWVDFDNDGWVDIYIRRSGDSILYHNDGASNPNNVQFSYFTQIASAWGTWGDFDNDGFEDLFAFRTRMYLFKNNFGIWFTDVSSKLPAGLDTLVPDSRAAVWGDFNGDGYLDLYVGGYEIWRDSDGGDSYPDFILMNVEDTSNPGERKLQLTWQESSTILRGRGVTACDFDDDNDLDIYVSNYRLQRNYLWRNDGAGNFTDVASTYNAIGGYGHTIGSAWGDIDNDGNFDLFVGNFSHTGQPESRFLQNFGAPDYHFYDKGTCGVVRQESYASPALGDYDNDGNLDLFFTTVYEGEYSRLYRNEGPWLFENVTSDANLGGLDVTYEAAWADYDNDGFLDLFCEGKLFKNSGNSNHWLKVKLIGNNTYGVNLSAIGAQVRINVGTKMLTRQVEASTGEGNQNDTTLHFGLGSHTDPLNLEIRWPDGTIQNYGPTAVDQIIEITR